MTVEIVPLLKAIVSFLAFYIILKGFTFHCCIYNITMKESESKIMKKLAIIAISALLTLAPEESMEKRVSVDIESKETFICEISNCDKIIEHKHSICSLASCTSPINHSHKGVTYFAHNEDDGHHYHKLQQQTTNTETITPKPSYKCDMVECTRSTEHAHTNCEVVGCKQMANHNHKEQHKENEPHTQNTQHQQNEEHKPKPKQQEQQHQSKQHKQNGGGHNNKGH